MKNKVTWLLVSIVVIAALVLTSCGPQQQQTTTPGTTVTGQVSGGTTTPSQPTTPTTVTTTTTVNPDIPQYGGTITITATSDVWDSEPYYGVGAASMFSMVFEPLGKIDWTLDRNILSYMAPYWPPSTWKGHLAESWEEPDPTTIIYHIRKGVNFQNKPPLNGRELTAYDVEFSYQRALGLGSGFTKPSPSALAGMAVIPIKSVTAKDKYTVEIKLKNPDWQALEVTLFNSYDSAWIVPKEIVQAKGDFKNWRDWIGSGPYMVTDHVESSSWTFTKNPTYWDYDERYPQNRLPYSDKIQMLVIPDFSTRQAALRSGKIDAMGGFTVEQAESLHKSNPQLVQITAMGRGYAIAMNVTKAPFSDIRVRQAMQMAIDNETIGKTYYKGYSDTLYSGIVGVACLGYYVPYKDWTADVKAGYAYNPTKAKELLTAAGFPSGFKTVYEVSPGFQNMDVDLAQILKTYWAAIGVEVEIKVVDVGTILGHIFSKTYDGMTWGQRGSDYNPLMYVKLMAYSGQQWNVHGGSDKEYDAIVDKAYAATTREEMMKYVTEADMYYIKQQWQLVTARKGVFAFLQPWFKGYNAEWSLGGMNVGGMYARTWVANDIKKKMTGK